MSSGRSSGVSGGAARRGSLVSSMESWAVDEADREVMMYRQVSSGDAPHETLQAEGADHARPVSRRGLRPPSVPRLGTSAMLQQQQQESLQVRAGDRPRALSDRGAVPEMAPSTQHATSLSADLSADSQQRLDHIFDMLTLLDNGDESMLARVEQEILRAEHQDRLAEEELRESSVDARLQRQLDSDQALLDQQADAPQDVAPSSLENGLEASGMGSRHELDAILQVLRQGVNELSTLDAEMARTMGLSSGGASRDQHEQVQGANAEDARYRHSLVEAAAAAAAAATSQLGIEEDGDEDDDEDGLDLDDEDEDGDDDDLDGDDSVPDEVMQMLSNLGVRDGLGIGPLHVQVLRQGLWNALVALGIEPPALIESSDRFLRSNIHTSVLASMPLLRPEQQAGPRLDEADDRSADEVRRGRDHSRRARATQVEEENGDREERDRLHEQIEGYEGDREQVGNGGGGGGGGSGCGSGSDERDVDESRDQESAADSRLMVAEIMMMLRDISRSGYGAEEVDDHILQAVLAINAGPRSDAHGNADHVAEEQMRLYQEVIGVIDDLLEVMAMDDLSEDLDEMIPRVQPGPLD